MLAFSFPFAKKMTREFVQPHENDVLFGRGKGSSLSPGNTYYRKLVEESLQSLQYPTAKLDLKTKRELSKRIIDKIHSLNPPGRFLDKDQETELWFIVDDNEVEKKVKTALRDAHRGKVSKNKTPPPLPPPTLGSNQKLANTREDLVRKYHITSTNEHALNSKDMLYNDDDDPRQDISVHEVSNSTLSEILNISFGSRGSSGTMNSHVFNSKVSDLVEKPTNSTNRKDLIIRRVSTESWRSKNKCSIRDSLSQSGEPIRRVSTKSCHGRMVKPNFLTQKCNNNEEMIDPSTLAENFLNPREIENNCDSMPSLPLDDSMILRLSEGSFGMSASKLKKAGNKYSLRDSLSQSGEPIRRVSTESCHGRMVKPNFLTQQCNDDEEMIDPSMLAENFLNPREIENNCDSMSSLPLDESMILRLSEGSFGMSASKLKNAGNKYSLRDSLSQSGEPGIVREIMISSMSTFSSSVKYDMQETYNSAFSFDTGIFSG